jgi:hypothetical protein
MYHRYGRRLEVVRYLTHLVNPVELSVSDTTIHMPLVIEELEGKSECHGKLASMVWTCVIGHGICRLSAAHHHCSSVQLNYGDGFIR